MSNESKFKSHVFVCTKCSYKEENGENCSEDIPVKFRKNLKSLSATIWDKHEVRINASGCLGQCERGISCVIYPQEKWLLDLRKGDEQKVMDVLQGLDL